MLGLMVWVVRRNRTRTSGEVEREDGVPGAVVELNGVAVLSGGDGGAGCGGGCGGG